MASKFKISAQVKKVGQLAVFAGLALGVGMCTNVNHCNRDT